MLSDAESDITTPCRAVLRPGAAGPVARGDRGGSGAAGVSATPPLPPEDGATAGANRGERLVVRAW